MIRFFVISLSVLTIFGAHGAPETQGRPYATDESDAIREEPRIVVVVSTKNPLDSLTFAELARIYLRKKIQRPNGEPVTVYERPTRNKIRQEFSRKVLDKKPKALREYWMNLTLTRALKPPKVLRSPKLVKRYLARVKGGIGYLYEDEVDETVKVVEIVRKRK